MNFKVRDTAWFVGVGSSVLLFMVGLFSGFFLSGIPIFFINAILFMVGLVTVIAGAGLLLAATEVYVKLHNFKSSPLLQAHSSLYSAAVGEDRDSLQTSEVIDSLKEFDVEEPKIPTYAMEAKEISYAKSKIEKPESIFNVETAPIRFTDEEVNSFSLTPTQLLTKIDKVQAIINNNKEAVSRNTADTHPTIKNPRIITLEYPKTKPTIHEKIHAVQDSEESGFETESVIKVDFDLQKIILIGDKGIDPLSDDFRKLLEKASLMEDENFVLRLKGKTFGLGARGIKVQQKNTEFTAFNKSDISKMLKKF